MAPLIAPFYNGAAHAWDELMTALEIDDSSEEQIDMVISTTCSETLAARGKTLLGINARRTQRFRLICLLHHTSVGALEKLDKHLAPWAVADSLTLFGLSDHTQQAILDGPPRIGPKVSFVSCGARSEDACAQAGPYIPRTVRLHISRCPLDT